ncbi:MAG: hypothetical protein ACTHJ3_19715 [Pararhizobium sp.]
MTKQEPDNRVRPDPERLIDLLTHAIESAACAIRSLAGGDDPTGTRARDPILWAEQALAAVVKLSEPGDRGDLARLMDQNERLTAALEAVA